MPFNIKEFLELGEEYPIIDVRTTAEFEQGHIPGAHNIPLFSNEERAIVGTLYKKSGKDAAVLKGLEFVGPNMAKFALQAKKIAHNKKVLVHCWRGGMRSASMAWLFNTVGLDAQVLIGGYKAYRQYNRTAFDRPCQLIILGGYTGSGKTDILKEMQILGAQFVDLEGIANHRGSSFGQIGQEPQPTNEQFENNLAKEWLKQDENQIIWLEDESKPLGQVRIMDNLYARMRKTPFIFINIPRSIRAQRLVIDYASLDPMKLEEALIRIGRRIGGQNLKEAINALHAKDFLKVANITLDYYDKTYDYGVTERKDVKKIEIEVDEGDPRKNAELILKTVEVKMNQLL